MPIPLSSRPTTKPQRQKLRHLTLTELKSVIANTFKHYTKRHMYQRKATIHVRSHGCSKKLLKASKPKPRRTRHNGPHRSHQTESSKSSKKGNLPQAQAWTYGKNDVLPPNALEIVSKLVKYIINTNYFPPKLNETILLTIHKRGDTTHISNYRGIMLN